MRIASFIDHTALKQTAGKDDISQICEEALRYNFAAVCVPPYYVSDCWEKLRDSKVELATVVGFPFGYHAIGTKVEETRIAIQDGASEIDLVMNVAALKNGDEKHLRKEIAAIMNVIKAEGRLLKVIIESGMLTDEEIIRCCRIYAAAEVHFLKTSTGYAEKGASVAAVQLMRAHLPSEIRIKASGGIRDLGFARQLVSAGASRLGCSASVSIVKEEENEKK